MSRPQAGNLQRDLYRFPLRDKLVETRLILEANIPRSGPNQSWGALAIAAIPPLGGAFAVLGVIFGGFCYFVPISDHAPVAWVVVAAFVPICFVFMLIRMVELARSDFVIPRVQRTQGDHQKGILLLLEPSRLFGQGVAVSVFILRGGFEILIGVGFVLIVQQDQRIQIKVTSSLPEHHDIWEALIKNDPDTLRNTLVKPGHQVERAG